MTNLNRGVLALGAVLLLAVALAGGWHPVVGAVLLLSALGLVTVSSLAATPIRGDALWLFKRVALVGVVIGLGVYAHTLSEVLRPDAVADYVVILALFLLLAVSASAVVVSPSSSISWYSMLASWFLGVVVVLVATTNLPWALDSLMFQEVAAEALAEARNPFALTYIDIYTPAYSATVYGSGVSVDGILQFGYPYMPLSLVVVAPFEILIGDLRFAFGVAILASAVMLSRIGSVTIARRATAVFLLAVPHLQLVASGWMDPLVVLFAVGTLYAAFRSPRLASYASGALFAIKQYAVVLVVPSLLIIERPWRLRDVLRHLVQAVLVFAVFTVPFAAWDFPAFYRSVVELQFLQPFRPDSLSIPALFGDSYAAAPKWSTTLVLVVVVVVASVLVALRTPTGVQGMALASGFVLLVTFAFSKQAFGNYYSVAMAFLCAAAAAAEHPVAEPAQGAEYASTA